MIDLLDIIVEINVGLLGAVAIVATLFMTKNISTKFSNRWVCFSTMLFGIAAVLSTIILGNYTRTLFSGNAVDPLSTYYPMITLMALLLFLMFVRQEIPDL